MSNAKRNDRRIIIYGAILAALVLLYVVGMVFAPRPGAGERDPLLPALGQREIVRIVIDQPSEDAGADRQERELVFADEQWWVLDNRMRYPARGERVQAFLDELADARISRQVSENAALHEEFAVDRRAATGVRLYARSPDGEPTLSATTDEPTPAVATLLWGESAPSGGRYVRFADQDAVLETDAQVWFYLTQPVPYWSYLRVLPETVVADSVVEIAVELTGERERDYSIRKERTDEGDRWVLLDGVARDLDGAAVDRFARSIADLVGRRFYTADEELDAARRTGTIRVATGSGAAFTIELYLVDEQPVVVPAGNGIRLSPAGRPYPVEIAQTTLDQLSPPLETLIADE